MKNAIVALTWVGLVCISGCKNKDYERCLHDSDEYEKQKIECLKITDKAQQAACTDRNEVHKLTKDDCDKSYK